MFEIILYHHTIQPFLAVNLSLSNCSICNGRVFGEYVYTYTVFLIANRSDSEQTSHFTASELGLHCRIAKKIGLLKWVIFSIQVSRISQAFDLVILKFIVL